MERRDARDTERTGTRDAGGMMAGTFRYDLISFLRILYARRYFILKGTAAVTVAVMILSLVWPQTWRANGSVLAAAPKFKQELQLFPEKPFDVKTYESLMTSDGMYFEVIETLRWLNQAISSLLDTDLYYGLRDHTGERAGRLSEYEWVALADPLFLAEHLAPEGGGGDPVFQKRLNRLAEYGPDEIEVLYEMDPAITVFDMRRNLGASVEIVKETNLETVYADSIQVSAEWDTAAGCQLLANLWIDLFIKRAETTVREIIAKQVRFTREHGEEIEEDLAKAQQALSVFAMTANLDTLRAEAATKRVLLTGLVEERHQTRQTEEDFNLYDGNEPFLKQRRRQIGDVVYEITPQYDRALLPQRSAIAKQIETLENQSDAAPGTLEAEARAEKLAELRAEQAAVEGRIAEVRQTLESLERTIEEKQARLDTLQRRVDQRQNQWDSIQPLLAEAALLENRGGDLRFADVTPDYAVKPDKRVFPRRSLMTLIGLFLGLILFTALSFFLDIWEEVVRPGDVAAGPIPPVRAEKPKTPAVKTPETEAGDKYQAKERETPSEDAPKDLPSEDEASKNEGGADKEDGTKGSPPGATFKPYSKGGKKHR